MSLNMQTNVAMPQNNMAFRAKGKNLAKILKEAQREVASKDCGKTAAEFAKDDFIETLSISFQENIAKDMMSKLNLQQAKNATLGFVYNIRNGIAKLKLNFLSIWNKCRTQIH